MPKKYKQPYTSHGSNYVHPSLGNGRGSIQQTPPKPETVNDRLSALRRSQASPESSERQRALADVLNQRSVPPALGGILGLPETAPPAARPGTRQRTRLRTPGPAPPRSWLDSNPDVTSGPSYRPAPRKLRTLGGRPTQARSRPVELCRFLDMVGGSKVSNRSLTHYTLKAIAQNWNDIDDDGLDYISEAPAHIRTSLLSYVSSYGPPEGISVFALDRLIHGVEDLTTLDLSGLAGWGFSLRELHSILAKPLQPTAQFNSQAVQITRLAESWDEEEALPGPSLSSLSLRSSSITPTITALSLSHPPSSITWPDLLSLTSALPTLTTLSLANWPFPTTTPNTTSIPTPSTTLSPRYAAFDSDFAEAATLLRTLSKQTYCLRSLDLSGNGAWLPALAQQRHETTGRNLRGDDWANDVKYLGPDWAGAWKGVTYLNLSQGGDVDVADLALGFLSDGAATFGGGRKVQQGQEKKLREEVVEFLAGEGGLRATRVVCGACRNRLGSQEGVGRDCAACCAWKEQSVREANAWVAKEVDARRVGKCCVQFRGHSSAGPLVVDFGWCKKMGSGW